MLAVSLVSHRHGVMAWNLVDQLVSYPEVSQVIVTLNIPEAFPDVLDPKVLLLQNSEPKGFGANHNAAFSRANGKFFCVINPDIELNQNPFFALLSVFGDFRTGVAAPLVLGPHGGPEDSMRRFMTPWSMLRRFVGVDSGSYQVGLNDPGISPDWVAGMLMLFRSDAYAKVGGFDERYFMYCEDADICARLWKIGYKVVGCLSVSVIHNAQRASHRSFEHFCWHLRSLVRYFLSHSASLPRK